MVRIGVSAMAHQDLDRLMNHCAAVAQKALARGGELAPFGAAIRLGGALISVFPDVAGKGMTGPAIVETLMQALRRLAREQQVAALALCYDGRVSLEDDPELKRDAIGIGLEHANGESVEVFVTYRRRRLLGYKFGATFALPRTRSFFSNEIEH